MLFFDPDNLEFTVIRKSEDDKPIVIVKIHGFTDKDEADMFSNNLLALHGEAQSETLH